MGPAYMAETRYKLALTPVVVLGLGADYSEMSMHIYLIFHACYGKLYALSNGVFVLCVSTCNVF